MLRDRHWWMATVDGGVWDYNTIKALKKSLESEGHEWVVYRMHRKGGMSIVEKSKPNKP